MNDANRGLHVIHIEEPELQFRYNQRLAYPRDGLYLFGPLEEEPNMIHKLRYGVIGTQESVKRFRLWSRRINQFISIPEPTLRSGSMQPQHVPFPSFSGAFHVDWPTEPPCLIEDLDTTEIHASLRISNRYEAIKKTVDLFVDRLISENNRLEYPPAFWFVVIPEQVYQLGRPQSTIGPDGRVKGVVQAPKKFANRLEQQPKLFTDEELDIEVYKYAKDFRRQLKARLLPEKIVTQIVRETTLVPEEFRRRSGLLARRVQDPATVAWNLATAAFYKAGGRPWQLADVRPGVCYVGLVYKRSDLSTSHRQACCAAQMFLTNGDGVVFRGALGPWFQPDTREFHLDRSAARDLVRMVIGEYKRLHMQPPQELFIHAQSAFSHTEWSGFEDAINEQTNLVGVQVRDAHEELKLFRLGNYPVIRGTAVIVSEYHAYLWTSGYVSRLGTYMGPETPNPLSIRILKGVCDLSTVLRDILGLTKINFNSCIYGDRFPVTIRFANAVGDVLMSAPVKGEPKLPFKFYI